MTFTGQLINVDPADRPDWLAYRRNKIGGSDIAGLLGLSSWSSPWSIWAEKCGLLGEEPDNEVMEAGRWLELSIAPWFTHRSGLHVIGAQSVVEAADDELASCTVDGFVAESAQSLIEDALGVHEIKTTGFGKRWEPIPPHVQAQCQWQMYVTGLQRVWLAVLMGRRLDVHELERDDDDILFMVERAHKFWDDHVATGIPPATDGSDATLRALGEVYPQQTPGQAVELDSLASVLEQWEQAKAARLAAEKVEKEAKAAIQAALGDAEEGTIEGERVVSWRAQSRRSIDVDALRQNDPQVAEHYEQTTTFRVLRPTSKKTSKERAA